MDQGMVLAYIASVARIAGLMVVGVPFLEWSKRKITYFCEQRFSRHSSIMIGRIILYSGLIFIVVAILHELGFNVSALLGVAGVCGVAIGFASQTSISNIMSGFFLVLERPFSLGDT